jgi:predicted dehydrogenase
MELFGTEAGARFSPLTLYRTDHHNEQDISVDLPRTSKESWDNIAGHFIDCIQTGKRCSAPLRHGLRVQQMMEALLKSSEVGKEIRIKS